MASSTIYLFLPYPKTELARFRAAHHLETQRLQDQHRLDSVSEAQEYIAAFVRSRWEEHFWASIRVTCGATMAELRDIGRRPREEGVRACGGLVRVPVIHQEVAEALWEFLAPGQGRMIYEEEPDEQEDFEAGVVARMAEEMGGEETAEDRKRGAGSGLPGCVFCEGRPGRTCQIPADNSLQPDLRRETGGLDGVLWQREEMACPCQKTYEDRGEGHSSDDHGSETSVERSEAGMSSVSASTVASTRSSLSQMFMWGRRS